MKFSIAKIEFKILKTNYLFCYLEKHFVFIINNIFIYNNLL